MQTLTCPWNIFVNEPVADELSLPSPLDPHLDKCHGLPNGRISMFFCHSRGGKTVILLPWRLQINSIMQYLIHSQ